MSLHIRPEDFQAAILKWFAAYGRKNLPWQITPTAYQVWVSEIMLQQTQVSTAIPYFNSFIKTFPSVEQLAAAASDDVLNLWSGLGYYARARNLHKTAQIISGQFNNIFPASVEQLQALPGIGRSTAGAIASLAMGQASPILDGNVKRVLCRFFAIEGWPGKADVQKRLWHISEQLTPLTQTAEFNQAMMDMGATRCTRSKPDCSQCPLKADCLALKNDLVKSLPTSKKKAVLPVREKYWLVVKGPEGLLLHQNPPAGLWGGLWAFPQFDSLAELEKHCQLIGLSAQAEKSLTLKRHTFSHFHLDYTTFVYKLDQPAPSMPYVEEALKSCWYQTDKHVKIGLPAPVSRLIDELNN